MMYKNEFAKNFHGHPVPQELLLLLEFDNHAEDYYAEGFELALLDEQWMLNSYSEDERFLKAVFEFAQADGTGSTYAIWQKSSNEDLSHSPVLIFGSEGGFHVVADNLPEFFRLLALDAEPMVDWERVSYYKDESDPPSTQAPAFRAWLLKHFNLQPAGSAEEIIQPAQEKHGDAFKNWIAQFYNG